MNRWKQFKNNKKYKNRIADNKTETNIAYIIKSLAVKRKKGR